ncbi:hypothetical protein OUZ56_028316 [Daphnia magna]|uniref:Uncharacterized protein n=1 Tax=Daphnia magna TaxID=35525 RepID=A0ABR0B3I8_9CRUS|nr:hypothetical protein OUZ56_028316 [Daphnia magna]
MTVNLWALTDATDVFRSCSTLILFMTTPIKYGDWQLTNIFLKKKWNDIELEFCLHITKMDNDRQCEDYFASLVLLGVIVMDCSIDACYLYTVCYSAAGRNRRLAHDANQRYRLSSRTSLKKSLWASSM